MKKPSLKLLLVSTLLAYSPSDAQTITSPSGTMSMTFDLTEMGEPTYKLMLGTIHVIRPSKLGIALKDDVGLTAGFIVAASDTSSVNDQWETVWGEERKVTNRYRELAVTLVQPKPKGRKVVLRFRLFDDGLGFRYEFPRQPDLGHFMVSGERTEFLLTGDHLAFWMPGDYDTNEYDYSTTPLSAVDASRGLDAAEIAARTGIGRNVVQTPLMMKTKEKLYLNIHEAALVNYPAMHLEIDQEAFRLSSRLVPDATGTMAYLQTPCTTPWRTVIVAPKATDILASRIILNLNEPSIISDPSWIKPQKFVGIWWELHVGKTSWNYADVDNVTLNGTDWSALKPNGRHGATTERTKRYIDFAATHGIDAVLVEGWNIGWEDWFGKWKEEVFDFVTPYPDFDVEEVQRYAAAKRVKMIMHHETSSSVTNYERRMDEAYRFMKKHGYDAVKTGYVGRIIPRGEYHDGQWMNNHYVRVARKTAEYKIMIDVHEPSRPTGLHRTYPNWLASEAARGNEFNAWSKGNPPDHETILPFTRLMGGPMDYTPGIFQIRRDYYQAGRTEQVHTTLAKQLALYVTIYSPLQMVADLPENYERFPDAFRFIKDVAVDWDESRYLEGEPGDYLTIARKARGSDDWFLGSITDENARKTSVNLGFLDPGRMYEATVYGDAPDAHWEKNPMAYQIKTHRVTRTSILDLRLAAGGGAAVRITPLNRN